MNNHKKIQVPKPNIIEVWFYRISAFTILVAAVSFFFFFHHVFFPSQNLEILSDPAKVSKKIVKPGETISFEYKYCKLNNKTSFMTVSFIDTVLLPAFITVKDFPVGCNTIYPEVVIPQNANEGRLKMVISVEYKSDFLIVEHHEFQSEEFLVKN